MEPGACASSDQPYFYKSCGFRRYPTSAVWCGSLIGAPVGSLLFRCSVSHFNSVSVIDLSGIGLFWVCATLRSSVFLICLIGQQMLMSVCVQIFSGVGQMRDVNFTMAQEFLIYLGNTLE